jgi:hypothetical protein
VAHDIRVSAVDDKRKLKPVKTRGGNSTNCLIFVRHPQMPTYCFVDWPAGAAAAAAA